MKSFRQFLNESKLNESHYNVNGITLYEDPTSQWIRNQLNKGIDLRIIIDGDFDESYFGLWTVWKAYDAIHKDVFDALGMSDDESISLHLYKDHVEYWGYNNKQLNMLKNIPKLQKIYPNGIKFKQER